MSGREEGKGYGVRPGPGDARRELLHRNLMARAELVDDMSVDEIVAVVEDTFLEVPLTSFLAILRINEPPPGEAMLRLGEEIRLAGAFALIAMDGDVRLESLDDEQLLRIGLCRTALIHRVPYDGEGMTPCCHKTVFELPRDERATSDDALVTCRGDNYCTRHHQGRWRCRAEKPAGSCHIGEWP